MEAEKMSFMENLEHKATEVRSIVCMGLDPTLEKIPVKAKTTEDKITKFYSNILEAMITEGVVPAAVKPNYAFFAQYGFDGLRALKDCIEMHQTKAIPVILDAKRGDIGKTSEAYAREVFEFWNADAVTLSPYLGTDSIEPFLKYSDRDKGVYILARTSNKGAVEIQNLKAGDNPIYIKVAERIVDWSRMTPGCVGAVVGATSLKEFRALSRFFVGSGQEVPLLIPGVGAQGGSAKDIIEGLKETGNELFMHRINSSSGINYAYERYGTDDYAGAAVKAINELNSEIRF